MSNLKFGLSISCAAMLLASLASGQAPSTTVVNIDVTKARMPISPYVYGMSYCNAADIKSLNLPVNRNGGNATTRYNWLNDATSSGSDYYFLSHPNGPTLNAWGASMDTFIQNDRNGGSDTIITIPIIGWVAKLNGANLLWSFSVSKYGAQQATAQYQTDAGNGVKTDGSNVTGNDPNDANIPVTISYQQSWMQHIVTKFKNASSGGVKFYCLDNEPSLWFETHRDVTPQGDLMANLFTQERDAAIMLKGVDPGAKTLGPEEWGWLGYLYSGYDLQYTSAHGYNYYPDRVNHGNMDQSAYLLQQFAAYEAANGKRLLDVFTLHYYPQTNWGDSDSSSGATQWRNRSTRSLWDPNYRDESWIGQNINLIPRMQAWVNQYYPGTALGVTEYQWNGESLPSGALAVADALGIYGSNGVYMALHWAEPTPNSMTYRVFQMYRNYDGFKSTFGSTSVQCQAPNRDLLAAYAAVENPDPAAKVNTLRVMVINKDTAPATVQLKTLGTKVVSNSTVYQLTSSAVITQVGSTPSFNRTITVPAQSLTLVVCTVGQLKVGGANGNLTNRGS